MACNKSCKLCDKFVVVDTVTLTGGNMALDLPAGSYKKGGRYCIVITKTIPVAPTNTPVVFTIGGGEALYPFTDSCCAQATVCDIKTREKYPVRVVTNSIGGAFRWVGRFCRDGRNDLPALDGTAPAAPAAPTA